MSTIGNQKQIYNAIKALNINQPFQEFKLKLNVEDIDLTDKKSYKLMLESLYNKYEKDVYNLKGEKNIKDICVMLNEAFGANKDLESYKRFYKIDKVGFFNKIDKENKVFSKLNLTLKIYNNHKTIGVDFMLIE